MNKLKEKYCNDETTDAQDVVVLVQDVKEIQILNESLQELREANENFNHTYTRDFLPWIRTPNELKEGDYLPECNLPAKVESLKSLLQVNL